MLRKLFCYSLLLTNLSVSYQRQVDIESLNEFQKHKGRLLKRDMFLGLRNLKTSKCSAVLYTQRKTWLNQQNVYLPNSIFLLQMINNSTEHVLDAVG